ncbi:MAG: MFS transporter [Gammaproteobacteria bacterium]|nr:MFS transporter [Gammaproteobacteria bacterium]MDE0450624.1 MFS transporter [Gammaproteobacteria bacterium]
MEHSAESKALGIRDFLHPKVAALLFLGFSAGLPYLLIFSTLSIWLREAGVERAAVTYFAWAALGYSFKFVWAPLVDKLPLPVLSSRLGQRRGWMLVAQGAVIGAIVLMAYSDPASQQGLQVMALAAVALGFSSATQDIVVDAYRIEAAEGSESVLGVLSGAYMAGYRCALIVAGAVALYLATAFGTTAEQYLHDAWRWTYLCMAAAMLVGVATTLIVTEPVRRSPSRYFHDTSDYARFVLLFALIAGTFIAVFVASSDAVTEVDAWLSGTVGVNGVLAGFLAEAMRLVAALALALGVARLSVSGGVVRHEIMHDTYIAPVADFFARYGRIAVPILLLVGFYRVSDMVMGVIANVFYVDMGYTKNAIATASKLFGVGMTILGSFLGGYLALKFRVIRVLMLGGVLAMGTNLLFIALAAYPGDVQLLYMVVAADNLSAGLATAAFVAYLSSLTSLSFTATQYAIFSSLMTLFPKLLGGYSGQIVDALGYPVFFAITAAIGVPVLFLIYWLTRRMAEAKESSA